VDSEPLVHAAQLIADLLGKDVYIVGTCYGTLSLSMTIFGAFKIIERVSPNVRK
jgi:hypothetical protein